MTALKFQEPRTSRLRQVHPSYDVKAKRWFTREPGLRAEAPFLADLKAKLPADVEIIGYYPLGTPVPDFHRKAGGES